MNKTDRESGSVSVYLIIIVVPIFLFVGILVDFARIRLADRESELAVKAGIRSVMSGFDKKLQAYGLFGLDGITVTTEERFKKALQANLPDTAGEASFQYTDTSPSASPGFLTPTRTLADSQEFRRQMIQEMKYRAPIELALEVTDKLKKTDMTNNFTEGRWFAEQAEKLDELLERREQKLDDAWILMERLHDKTVQAHRYYSDRLQELNGLAEQIGLNTVENVKREIDLVQTSITTVEQSIQSIDGSIASLTMAAEQSQSSIQTLLSSRAALTNQMQQLLQKKNDLEHILQLLLQYAELTMSTRIEAGIDKESITGLISDLNDTLNAAKKANDELRSTLEQAGVEANNSPFGKLQVLPDEYFTSYQADTAAVAALFAAFAAEVNNTLSYSNETYGKLRGHNDAYASKASDAFEKRKQADSDRQTRNRSIKSRKQTAINLIGSILDIAKEAIGGCRLNADADTDRPAYEQLRSFYVNYAETGNDDAASEAVTDMDNAKRISASSLRLLGFIADALTDLRDSAFVNEFALSKFNYRTFGVEQNQEGRPKPSTTFSQPESHRLIGQEAEYVTYGFSSCSANIASTYGDMFAIRLAIHTLEQLTEPKNELLELGSPLLLLLSSTAQAAGDALQDMHKLTEGEQVPLSDKLSPAVTLGYADYLRLLMFIHGTGERKTARIQALVQLNTGADLRKVYTEISAKVNTSVKLWFWPGAFKLLGLGGLAPCQAVQNRCEFYEKARWRY